MEVNAEKLTTTKKNVKFRFIFGWHIKAASWLHEHFRMFFLLVFWGIIFYGFSVVFLISSLNMWFVMDFKFGTFVVRVPKKFVSSFPKNEWETKANEKWVKNWSGQCEGFFSSPRNHFWEHGTINQELWVAPSIAI